MNAWPKQKQAALLEWRGCTQSSSSEQGGSYGQYTRTEASESRPFQKSAHVRIDVPLAERRELRRRQRAHARRVRQQMQAIEQKAPSALRRLAQALCSAFTRPTYYRVVILLMAALLTVGTHTVLNVLRTVSAPGRWSRFQFSSRLRASTLVDMATGALLGTLARRALLT